MQPMSDKELDQLFQQKFGAFEPEVSPALWAEIADQLGPVKKKKAGFPVFWMAAASVVIVSLTGLWLMQGNEPMKLHGKSDPRAAALVKPVIKQPVAAEPVATNGSPATVEPKITRTAVVHTTSRPQLRTRVARVPEDLSNDKHEQAVVVASAKEPDQAPTISTGARTALDPIGTRRTIIANGANALVTASIPDVNPATEPEAPRRKIRSLGGLVNFVVGKVDRREDKIIEFTDNDEGTEVSGINLGLLKIKSKSTNSNK